jgi:hypothetical protein
LYSDRRLASRAKLAFAEEDRRELDPPREGMLRGFSLGNDLLLVDYTGRLFRDGRAAISPALTGILNRLATSAESWQARLDKLKSSRLLDRFFAATRKRLREVAAHLRIITSQTSVMRVLSL